MGNRPDYAAPAESAHRKTRCRCRKHPSGLAAAMQLNRRGHSVTVFERRDRVGGLLRYGIPNMKLDKSVIDRRVDLMKAEGIEFVTNADIGKDVKADKLLKEFDRVLLCCGAANPRDIKAEEEMQRASTLLSIS